MLNSFNFFGLVHGSWSREHAIHYLVQNAGIAREEAELEVTQCITVPAQAIVARMGFMKITQLRYRAQTLLGEHPNLYTEVLYLNCSQS